MFIQKRIREKVYSIIKEYKRISFGELCKVCPHHQHTIRKAIKYFIKKGAISYFKLGAMKVYFIMKHRWLMIYTKPERDQIYYNYIKQFELGVNLNRVSKDLKMDKRSFKREVKRLIKIGLVSEEKLSNMIIYKVTGKWKKINKK